MLNIIFIGAPGVGKGTQSALIEKDYSISHIATGDMLRENIANGTELGKTAKSYMDKGELVPDSLVIDMLKERIKKDDCKNGFMLDGFPRTIEQAKELNKKYGSFNYYISKDGKIFIHAIAIALISRMTLTFISPGYCNLRFTSLAISVAKISV